MHIHRKQTIALFLSTAIATSAVSTFAYAQSDDCIENINGRTVCGADADAVRARIRAEQAARGDRRSTPTPRFQQAGSAYSGFGSTVFVRGGYTFADMNALGLLEGGGPVAIGYRKALTRSATDVVSFETELVGFKRNYSDLGVPASLWSIAALGGIRYDFAPRNPISPYVSAAIGAAYAREAVDVGVIRIADGTFSFAYSGRAGLTSRITDNFGIEFGYRYLGFTNDGSIGLHVAEAGLNFNF